jgi:3-hydroxyacyl-CoA dehydrogenase
MEKTPAPEQAVSYHAAEGIATLTIDFPPVNALGAPMRDGLAMRLRQALQDETVKAIILVGAHDKFVAGADIRQFGQPPCGVHLHEIQASMDTYPKPIIAAIDGHALGGRLELALSANYRVAAARAKIGLPEVNLGILPGAGGTQRGTRLMGPQAALDLILSGRHVAAGEALKLGLIDEIATGDLIAAAKAMALKAVASRSLPRAISRTDKVADTDPEIFAAIVKKNAAKWRGTVAPFKIVECIEAATRLGPQEGLDFEHAAFQACLASPARLAQIHLFFAERAAGRIDGIASDTPARAAASVGVIGAGTMGGGIAMSLANAGVKVTIVDNTAEALEAGLDRVRGNYATSVKRGSTTQAKVDAALALITPAQDYQALADADVVIEAAFENMDVKKEIFGRLDRICKPGAILASNTSALSIDDIAASTSRPESVVGMHFFSPANVMKLLEVVRGKDSAPDVLVTAMSFAKKIGKVPVLAGNCDGFIGNRILAAYGRQADLMLEEGETPWSIDRALQDFGFPMGIYLMRDMAGLDVGWRMRQNRLAAGTLVKDARYPLLADRLCEQGKFGQKTGAGYYNYDGRDASPAPETAAILEAIAIEKHKPRRPGSAEEIVWRVLGAMVNEGARILDEKVAQRASDIDVTYVAGYGFPRHQGGPMFWAQAQGLDKVLAKIREYYANVGPEWKPSALLERLVAEGRSWDGKPLKPAAA